jgi:riboflavin kinase
MPRPEETQTLREIAGLGALHGLVEVSTIELAKRIGQSQQTASRRVLDLEKMGYIRREMGVRKQLMRLTEEGVNVLARELALYRKLFDHRDRLEIHGTIESGLGEGKYYLSQKGYVDQFQAKLGFAPFPGTLNVRVEGPETNKLRILKSAPSVQIDGFAAQDRTFGGVDAWKARLNDLECVVILPQRTHHARTLEVVAPEYLRDRLKLKDGDEVRLQVQVS